MQVFTSSGQYNQGPIYAGQENIAYERMVSYEQKVVNASYKLTSCYTFTSRLCNG
jgi:hypothetical protein